MQSGGTEVQWTEQEPGASAAAVLLSSLDMAELYVWRREPPVAPRSLSVPSVGAASSSWTGEGTAEVGK